MLPGKRNHWITRDFTDEQIEERFRLLEEQGWYWSKFNTYETNDPRRLIFPPRDDDRNGWCAEFVVVLENCVAPHWAFHEDALTPRPCGRDSYYGP